MLVLWTIDARKRTPAPRITSLFFSSSAKRLILMSLNGYKGGEAKVVTPCPPMSVEPRTIPRHGTAKGFKHDNSSNGNITGDMVPKDQLVSLVASAQVRTGMVLRAAMVVRVVMSSLTVGRGESGHCGTTVFRFGFLFTSRCYCCCSVCLWRFSRKVKTLSRAFWMILTWCLWLSDWSWAI